MATIHLGLLTLLCFGVQLSFSKSLKRQKRDWIIDSFRIKENHPGPFPYPLGSIELEKNVNIFALKGEGVDQEPLGVLAIIEETGMIMVKKAVDYEKHSKLKVTFTAVKRTNRSIVDTQLGIEINIDDINDNAPEFVLKEYQTPVLESTKQGSDLIHIQAHDPDTGINGKFDFKIESWSPKHDNVEFYIQRLPEQGQTAKIGFKGCLESKKAKKYNIIVVATDHGEDVQLSSSCIVKITLEDANSHQPVITKVTGPAKVTEEKENVTVLQIQVDDEDIEGSKAWRALFKIQGDSDENFKITTDPKTNAGSLIVAKALDFEQTKEKHLNITVYNELPFYSCTIKTRNKIGFWEVIYGKGSRPDSRAVTIKVLDINDAPVFTKGKTKVHLMENTPAGHYLKTFTANDTDRTEGSTIVYKVKDDPANWIKVDPRTGKVTTKQPLDRESEFVKNNTYKVLILAADNGIPPMTGTSTLTVHIMDENDNLPVLPQTVFDVCQSEKPSKSSIIIPSDLDEGIYSGPFTYKLNGDVQGKWSVEPSQGDSTYLVKDSKVHSGNYEIQLQVSDMQQESAYYNLSVTVCECINQQIQNCRMRKSTSSAAGGTLVGVILIALLLIAGLLLLAFLVSCKKKKSMIPDSEGSGQHLMDCNTETPGNDCKVAKRKRRSSNEDKIKTKEQVQIQSANQTIVKTRIPSVSQAPPHVQSASVQRQASYYQSESLGASARQKHRSSGRRRKSSSELSNGRFVSQMLTTKLNTLQAPRQELGDYVPHVYADETNTEPNDLLDAISIPDLPFDPDLDLNLDSRFHHLASICLPSENASQS